MLYSYMTLVHLHKGKECCSSNSGKHFVASAGRTHLASSVGAMDCTSHQPLLRDSQYSEICDAFFMSDRCLYFICIIYCAFVWPIYQTVVLFWGGKKKKKDNGVEYVYECQWWVWKEPIIGGKSLSCGAVLAPERHLDVCVTPPAPALFSRSVLYVFFLILGCTSGKRLPSTPQYVPQWHFTCVLARVFVSKRRLNICNSMDRDYRDATDQIRGPKRSRILKTSKRQIMMGDQILLPTVCWWPFVPWFCGLNCMPMFILSYQSGIFGICTQLSHSTRCKTGTFLLYCRWIWVFLDMYKLQSSFSLYSLIHTCKSWSHRYGYIYIILYFKIGAFYFRFCSSTKSDVCIPSYI